MIVSTPCDTRKQKFSTLIRRNDGREKNLFELGRGVDQNTLYMRDCKELDMYSSGGIVLYHAACPGFGSQKCQ